MPATRPASIREPRPPVAAASLEIRRDVGAGALALSVGLRHVDGSLSPGYARRLVLPASADEARVVVAEALTILDLAAAALLAVDSARADRACLAGMMG